MSYGELDGRADRPDVPRKSRRKSRFSVTDSDLAALRKRAARLKDEREAAEKNAADNTLF